MCLTIGPFPRSEDELAVSLTYSCASFALCGPVCAVSGDVRGGQRGSCATADEQLSSPLSGVPHPDRSAPSRRRCSPGIFCCGLVSRTHCWFLAEGNHGDCPVSLMVVSPSSRRARRRCGVGKRRHQHFRWPQLPVAVCRAAFQAFIAAEQSGKLEYAVMIRQFCLSLSTTAGSQEGWSQSPR